MAKLVPKNLDEDLLFFSIGKMIPQDAIVRIVKLLIEKIYPNLSINEEEKDTEVGRPEYPRELLLMLYVYGYIERLKSSRQLEKQCKKNLEVIWLMGSLQPDHWTISNYRKKNRETIKEAIKIFKKFLNDSGYIEGKTIVIDGTKLEANASSDNTISLDELKERLRDNEEAIDRYLSACDEADAEEDEIERLRKEREELERENERLMEQIEKLKLENKKILVKTDPDSRLMKTKNGYKAAYNIQLSCDSKNKLIVATEVDDSSNDYGKLKIVYDKTKEMLSDKEPEEIIADSGYYVPEQIEQIEKETNTEVYIPPLPDQSKGDFIYDAEKDEYICPEGHIMKFEKIKKDKSGRKRREYRTTACDGCRIRESCTNSIKGRIKIRYLNQDFREFYKKKMQSTEAKEKIKLRKLIVEHPIGTIKMWLGRQPLLLRGREKVETEINLVTFAYNLLRVFNIDGYERLRAAIEGYNWNLKGMVMA